MADTAYTDNVTVITADTMNDLNRLHYTLLGDPTTVRGIHDAVHAKGSDVASAGTVDLTGTTGDYVHITGTTTITAITINSGDQRIVVFDGSLTLTHHATTLILPAGANITTAAGDIAVFRGDGSGNTRCLLYSKATGLPIAIVPGATRVFLDSKTASDSANLQFTTGIDSTYDDYLVIGIGILPATDAAQLNLNMSVNGGSTYEAGASDYAQALTVRGANGTSYNGDSTGFTNIVLTGTTNGLENTSAQGGLNFQLNLYRLSSTSVMKQCHIEGSYVGNVSFATMTGAAAGISATLQTTAVNALRFQMNTGNITSGTFYLYGIKKT